MSEPGLVGRRSQRAHLERAIAVAAGGRGGLLLVSGEAGVGKTRLVEAATAHADVRCFAGGAQPAASPYGPVVAVLRAYLRAHPQGLDDCGPLRHHLAVLLPELGPAGDVPDRATLVEALRCAFITIARDAPTVLLLDDLQWSDDATLELLCSLAPTLRTVPMLVVAAYRSDELTRAHPLARLRHELRRARCLEELDVPPLERGDVTELAAAELGAPVSPRLAKVLHDRTGGIPFFVEELVLALDAAGRLADGPDGRTLTLDGDVPLPQTIRDAVLVRAAPLSEAARRTAEVAAVAGVQFDLDLTATLGSPDGLAELLAHGLIFEEPGGWGAFRHPLAREALYEDIPWVQRTALHRAVAERLEDGDADRGVVAGHWLAARDATRALGALLPAIEEHAAVHAYRDASRLGQRALELWPEGERAGERIALLDAHGRHAELAGDLAEAARAQREVVAARRAAGAGRSLADAERRIAALYALQGDRPRALAARRVSAEAFAAAGLPGEAAAERLVIAGYQQSAAQFADAIETAAAARAEALRAERVDLRARAMALEGVARVKGGAFDEGIAIVREALALALEHELTADAAEVYQRLGTALEISGDYAGAADALDTALGFCERSGQDALEQVCLSCMAYVLRELGDWQQVDALCGRLIADGVPAGDTLVADGVLGAIEAWRGRPGVALGLLTRCLETATALNVVSMQCDSAAALAWLAASEGDPERARGYCELLLERWERSEDRHYAVWGLRWSAGWLAQQQEPVLARACVKALSSIAGSTGHPDALAALACSLGELALAEGDTATAVPQFLRAVELHAGLQIPFEAASVRIRAGAAIVAAGDRDGGIAQLVEAHRIARRLGATVLVAQAAGAVAALGASLDEHLGARAADEHARAGLSRREHEVLVLVAEGLTNREIATRLVLSTRTVDAHLRSILTKLGCKTRTEASARAGELGLLGGDGSAPSAGHGSKA